MVVLAGQPSVEVRTSSLYVAILKDLFVEDCTVVQHIDDDIHFLVRTSTRRILKDADWISSWCRHPMSWRPCLFCLLVPHTANTYANKSINRCSPALFCKAGVDSNSLLLPIGYCLRCNNLSTRLKQASLVFFHHEVSVVSFPFTELSVGLCFRQQFGHWQNTRFSFGDFAV